MNSTLLFDFIQPLEVVRRELDGPCQLNSRCYTLLYLLNGSAAVQSEGTRLTLSEGELLLLPSCRCQIEGVGRLVQMAFSTSSISFRQMATRLFFRPALPGDDVQSCVQSILSSLAGAEPFATDQVALELHCLLLALARALIAAPPDAASIDSQEAEALERITSYIREHLSEEIEFQDLTACSGCPSKQVYALFRKHFHTTPIRYLSDCRIEAAKQLLMTSPMSITQIATACGFQTVHYFSRVFKTSTGLSPNAFRRQPDAPAPFDCGEGEE